MQQTTTKSVYDVEVLETESLWAKYGTKLPDEPPRSPAPSRYQWRRLGTYSLGVLFTLSLHLALLSSMLLGTAGKPPLKPLTEGALASSPNSDASEFVTTLILLNDHSITPSDQPADESAYASPQLALPPAKAEVIIASLDVTVPEVGGSANGTDANSPTIEATGDDTGRAMLFGRYMGQVKARIERAWEYPITTLPDKFECKVQIKQTKQGEVKEVTLQHCGDDPAWQVSLVQAIQRASPLSAAPDESVFTEVMTLSFSATLTVNTVQLAQ